ncbi:MAG: hypothetical protein U9Q92_01145 [archaeon]|nr:hypothetical protein [archaeon]
MKRLYFIGLLMIFLLVGAGYSSHMLSSETRVNISGVFDVDGRNWTAPNVCEIVNFTIINDGGSNDSIVSVNVTLPSGFTLNASTIGNSNGWACSNLSATIVNCSNMSVGGLGNGNTMYVWFNVTSPDASDEDLKGWDINTTDNATGSNGTVLILWVDGNVTEAASVDALDAYVNAQPVLNWTNHSGCDNVSGLINYTIYHSADSASVNFTINGNTSDLYYPTLGLSENQVHYFKVQTNDKAGNAVNSSVISTTIDTTPPSVYLNTTNNANFSDTYYPSLYFNVTDNFDTNMSCELFIDSHPNGTGYVANSTSGLSIQVNTSLLGKGHSWYVNCTDNAGNTGKSTPPRILNVVGADIVVESVYFNTTADTNPIASSDMKVFAVVKNVGNRNISQNVTVTFELDGTPIGTSTITNETLTAGQNETVNVTYTSNFQSTFNHTLKAEADVNGAIELNASNNDAYNYSLYVGYNVTITEITPDTVDNTSVNVSVTFSVKYPDESAATSISWSNVSIASSTYSNDRINTSAFSSPSSGIYTFNVTSYVNYNGDTNPGLHTISISVTRNESGKVYSGLDTDAYNQTVPMPDHSGTDCDGAISNSHAEDVVITIKNSGNYPLYNITATPEIYLGSTKKDYISPTSRWSIPNSLAAGATHACTFTITPTTDGDYEIRLTVTGNDGAGRTYSRAFGVIDFFTVSTQTQQTPDPGTTGTDTTSSDTDYPNCVVNDDCFGDEFCNSHLVCKELDCADDEKIVDHACVKKDVSAAVKTVNYSLAITDGPDELEIEHGESRNTTFKLKNNGEKTVTELKFELKLKDATVNISEWYAVLSNYSTTLKKGIVESVKVEINTADFSIGVYEIIAFAKSGNASGNMTFTLKVTPDDDEKVVINDTMAKLDSDYTEIYNQLQVLLHENVNNTNLTGLNDTLAKVGEYLKTAKLAIESGDYLSAYQNQMSADSLMVEIKSKLDGDDLIVAEKKIHWLRNSLTVIVLAVLGVFGFQYYRNMQESGGYHPEKGFRIKKKSEFREKIMGEISALKGSIRGKKEKSAPALKPSLNYASYNSNKKQDNILKRIVEIFSVKRQNPNQKTLYDIGNVYNKKVKKKKVFCY